MVCFIVVVVVVVVVVVANESEAKNVTKFHIYAVY